MKKAILILILLSLQVQALNDINITIENSDTGLCISGTDLTDQTCNSTQVLTLDGSLDHQVYFTYEQVLNNSASNGEIALYGVTHIFSYLLAFGAFFAIILIPLMGFYVLKKILFGG